MAGGMGDSARAREFKEGGGRVTRILGRREFLSRAWKWGAALAGVAAAWTSWDLLRPAGGGGPAGPVATVPPEAVPVDGVLEVKAVNGFLTRVDDEVVALWWRCPHLGCKVPWCETSGQFECPCHGSVFNRVGEYRRGPSPRGMDRYATNVVEGVIEVDTSVVIEGRPPGAESIVEPPRGPECLDPAGGET